MSSFKKLVKYKKLSYTVYLSEAQTPLKRPVSDLNFQTIAYAAEAIKDQFAGDEPGRFKLFSRFLSQRCIGFYLAQDQTVLAYGWGMLNDTERSVRSNNHFPVGPWEGHIFYCFTHEAYRGHNLYPCLIHTLGVKLLQMGARRIWIDTNDFNAPAQKGILKVGYRFAGILTNFFVFRRRLFTRLRLIKGIAQTA